MVIKALSHLAHAGRMHRVIRPRPAIVSGSLAALGLIACPASAQSAISADSISGYIDFRGGVADGDQAWLKGGYGKARYGGDSNGDAIGRLEIGEAGLVWHPRFSQLFGAVVHLEYAPGAEHGIDIVESYLSFKAPPGDGLRVSGRAGVFYPPASLEHDSFAWTVDHSITPSAINTWIGEEIKVAGVEGTVRHALGPGDLSFTVSAFGGDDTAGTLIAFRGWALHDEEATVFGRFPIPAVAPKRQALFKPQDPYSQSMDEIDGRVGGYAGLSYSGDGFSLSTLYYDNAGNRLALDGGQWGWATRFTNIGASLKPAPQATILAQYLTGETRSGWSMPQVVIDANFSSFYVLGAWDFGVAELTARYDDFHVDDQSFVALDNENESGSAITLALGRQLTRHLLGRLELMRIDSDRPQRADAGLDPKDRQTVLQTSVRYDF
jgi:hypothetical protein